MKCFLSSQRFSIFLRALSLTVLVSGICGRAAVADVLVLSGGEKLRGKVVNVSEVSVIAVVNGKENVFPRASVAKIEFDPPAAGSVAAPRPEVARHIAAGQKARLRISSWDPVDPSDPNTFGVFYELQSDLLLNNKERIAAGSVVLGKVKLQSDPNGKLQFTKTLESGYDPRRLLKLTHGPVSPLLVIDSAKAGPVSVSYSGADPDRQAGTSPEAIEALRWLKVGNVVEWSFVAK